MELALSLGDNIIPKPFPFLDRKMGTSSSSSSSPPNPHKDLGFCKGNLGGPLMIYNSTSSTNSERSSVLVHREEGMMREKVALDDERKGSSDPPVQLDLLPFSPVHRHPPPQLRFPWLSDNLISDHPPGKGLQVLINRRSTTAAEEVEDTAAAAAAMSSSPNSVASAYRHHKRMDFTSMFRRGKRDFLETRKWEGGGKSNSNSNSSAEMVLLLENRPERSKGGGGGGGGGSDEEDMINGLARKKLRLTKDQSAFLEESFKEHSTLNPRQKMVLSKQLNLRPRQVEVWFQNRRARTKLKQTEVDCEYLKSCCETLTEENRRLQKELQELRALKSSKPFYMQLPATTLTMCPSCERVATAAATTTANAITVASPAATNVLAASGGGRGSMTNTTLSLC